MSERKAGPTKAPLTFGSLCKQLIEMCQISRNERIANLKSVRSVKTEPSEELALLTGSSTFLPSEQNPHEDYYRQNYEN